MNVQNTSLYNYHSVESSDIKDEMVKLALNLTQIDLMEKSDTMILEDQTKNFIL